MTINTRLTLAVERVGDDYALLDNGVDVCLVRPAQGEFPYQTAARAGELAELISEGWNARYSIALEIPQ